MNIKIEIKRADSSNINKRRYDGEVVWFNPKAGYGFVECGGRQFFVHYNAILMDGYRKLEKGQKVSFCLQPYGTYQQAAEVKII